MKKVFVILFTCFGIGALSQQAASSLYKKELGFSIDNDNLLFNLHDGYYTNGLFLKLNKAVESKKLKKIVQFELGQLIFNSETRKISDVSEIDRPFAGYLFFKYGQTVFTRSNIFSWNAEIGTIGPFSGAEAVQRLCHKIINVYNKYPGWETQLKTEPGINVSCNYMPLLQKTSMRFFKIVPLLQATLGTLFTNAKAGAYFCFGYFEDDASSSLWNATITSNSSEKRNRKYELFGFFYPQIILQAYNATVQGGLFRKDKGGYASGINGSVFQNNIGIVFSKKRLKYQAGISFQTKEAASQRKSSYWGSLSAGYRFN